MGVWGACGNGTAEWQHKKCGVGTLSTQMPLSPSKTEKSHSTYLQTQEMSRVITFRTVRQQEFVWCWLKCTLRSSAAPVMIQTACVGLLHHRGLPGLLGCGRRKRACGRQ